MYVCQNYCFYIFYFRSPFANRQLRRQRNRPYWKSNTSAKEILIKQYNEGKTITEASEIANINKHTVVSIIRQYNKDGGNLVRRKKGGPRTFKLTPEVLKIIEDIN